MSLLWALIRGNLPACVAVTVITILLGAFFIEKHRVVSIESELKFARSQSQSLSISNVALLASLKQQNTALANLGKIADEKATRAAAALHNARLQSKQYRIKAQKIRNVSPAADDCAQLKSLLEQFARP